MARWQLTTEKRERIINKLANGISENQIRQSEKVSAGIVNLIKKQNFKSIEKKKKEIQESVDAKMKKFPKELSRISIEAMQEINKAKLQNASAPQLAMVLGVCVDKLRLLLGESTQIIDVLPPVGQIKKHYQDLKKLGEKKG